METVSEQAAMERALAIAVQGWGQVAPNPLVGAVLLRDGAIVGEGYHAVFGGPHAEVAALESCDDPRGATCVVTLEPCAHHGQTAPCADALIRAGVAHVVVAIPDPNPAAAGGIARLQVAGIDVSVGLCEAHAAALNAPFLFCASRPDRPFVALKLATSLDGQLADANGQSQWLSGSEARIFVQWLRAGFGAIGVGRGTAVADDPLLTVRGPLEPRCPPTRVVFARDGEIPPRLRMFDTDPAPVVVVVPHSRVADVGEVVVNKEVMVIGANDLTAAMESLRRRGIESILIEGGGRLATSLLDEGLVDRLYWIQTPRWLGTGTPAFTRGPISLDAAESWRVTERRALGPDTLLVVDRRLCLQA